MNEHKKHIRAALFLYALGAMLCIVAIYSSVGDSVDVRGSLACSACAFGYLFGLALGEF